LEHDRPTLLLRLACEHLLGLRIERPGSPPGRLIAAARQRASGRRTTGGTGPDQRLQGRLDGLLTVGRHWPVHPGWLQQSVASYTPPTILVTLEKRCCGNGVDRWDVSSLSPNRRVPRQIPAGLNQALQRMPERRRTRSSPSSPDPGRPPTRPSTCSALPRGATTGPAWRLPLRSPRQREGPTPANQPGGPRPRGQDADQAAIYPIPRPNSGTPSRNRPDHRPLDDLLRLPRAVTYLRQFTPEFLDALAFRSRDSPLLRAVDLSVSSTPNIASCPTRRRSISCPPGGVLT
jgi:hypothetical protein